MKAFLKTLVLLPLLVAIGTGSSAEAVTLTSEDGGLEISGSLLGFDQDMYRLDTIYGPLAINAAGVTCQGAECPDLSSSFQRVSISGDPLLGRVLMPALIDGFARGSGLSVERVEDGEERFRLLVSDTDGEAIAEFAFHISTTEEGFADLLANESDIVLAARPINDVEHERVFEASLGDLRASGRSVVLALDGLIPVVSPRQPVKTLSLAQLAAIYQGDIQNWSAVGGTDQPIRIHALQQSNGLQQAVDAVWRIGLPIAAERHASIEALVRAVAADPTGIGLTRFGRSGNAERLQLSDDCGLTLSAERLDLKLHTYPLTLQLLAYTPERRQAPIAQALLSYLQTPAAQVIVQRSGFVDQTFQRIGINRQGSRLAQAVLSAETETDLDNLQTLARELADAEQLSTVFRLQANGALDPAAVSLQRALIKRASEGAFSGQKITLGLFAGSEPSRTHRIRLRRKADDLKDRLVESMRSQDAVRILDFQDQNYEPCDDTVKLNRSYGRLEVWIQ
jgi:phosphate transport system substrate-binding protein